MTVFFTVLGLGMWGFATFLDAVERGEKARKAEYDRRESLTVEQRYEEDLSECLAKDLTQFNSNYRYCEFLMTRKLFMEKNEVHN